MVAQAVRVAALLMVAQQVQVAAVQPAAMPALRLIPDQRIPQVVTAARVALAAVRRMQGPVAPVVLALMAALLIQRLIPAMRRQMVVLAVMAARAARQMVAETMVEPAVMQVQAAQQMLKVLPQTQAAAMVVPVVMVGAGVAPSMDHLTAARQRSTPVMLLLNPLQTLAAIRRA